MTVQYVEETVKLPKEAKELKDAIVGLVKASRKALQDGFQPTDIATIVSTEFTRLLTGIDGVEKLPEEVKEDLGASIECATLLGGQITKAALEKLPAPSV